MKNPSSSSRKVSANLVIRTKGFPSSSRTLAIIPPPLGDVNGYFDFLGLDPSASLQEIKKAYRVWARLWHPDGEEPDQESFLYLAHIYRILSDPEKRKEYQECIGPYVSEWELQQALDASSELIQGLSIEEEDKIKEKPKPASIQEGYSFWALSGVEYEDRAQQWYPYLLDVMKIWKINMPVQVGVGEIKRHFYVQVTPDKKIIWWFPPLLYPNGFSAFSAVFQYLKG